MVIVYVLLLIVITHMIMQDGFIPEKALTVFQ